MTEIGLAFRASNLRWNPFGEPDAEDMAALAVVEVDEYVPRLIQPGFAVQFMGDPGRGKSTHLMALHRFFPEAPYLRFPEGEKIPAIPHAPILFLDETQRLPRRLRREVFSRSASFAIGTHEDHTPELRKAGVQVASVWLRGLTRERLAQIVQRRIEWARRGPGVIPTISEARLDELIAGFGDNLAGILAQLYDEFQRIEEHGNDIA